MNKFEELEAFVRVGKLGSFSKAAKVSGIAKSAISRRLNELEGRLGVKLVHRTTRGLTLTTAGKSFYTQAEKLLDTLSEAEQDIADLNTVLSGTIRVTAPVSFANLHLQPLLMEFMLDHHEVDVELQLSDAPIDIIGEGFDFAIRIGQLSDSRMIAKKICAMNRVTCASPAYLKKMGTPNHPTELSHHHGLVTSVISESSYWRYMDESHNVYIGKPITKMKVNHGEMLVTAAARGLGICAVPTFVCYDAIKNGELLPILEEFSLRQDSIFMIFPQNRYLPKRVRALIDFLQEKIGEIPYWDRF